MQCDPESFVVDDPDYLAPPKRQRSRSKNWMNRTPEDRRRHPKAYLEYLFDAQIDGSTLYNEKMASEMLRNLSWNLALRRTDASKFLRSFLKDLAHDMDPSPEIQPFLTTGACAPQTLSIDPAQRVLRNL